MLRVSKHTDYGIVLLAAIVENWDGVPCSARELAEMTHMPLPMVSKILKVLCREGILTSQRGIKGGYSLARPATEVTLVCIVQALEGRPIALTECIAEPGECLYEESCPVQVNWLNINTLIRNALKEITLLDMIRPMPGLVQLGAGSEEPTQLPR